MTIETKFNIGDELIDALLSMLALLKKQGTL